MRPGGCAARTAGGERESNIPANFIKKHLKNEDEEYFMRIFPVYLAEVGANGSF